MEGIKRGLGIGLLFIGIFTNAAILPTMAHSFSPPDEVEIITHPIITASACAITGSTISVSFTAPTGSSAKDWIGLYAAGAENTSFGEWHYTAGATSGMLQFTAPTQPGSYEFRYLVNNGFTSIARASITIGSTITAPACAITGSTINVSFTAPTGSSARDWIGLYAAGAENTRFGEWHYTAGATSGMLQFTAPTQPGSYEFRYLVNNGFTSIARASFTIGSTITAPASAMPGSTINVSFTAPTGSSAKDWIGLYAAGAENTSFGEWYYTAGATSGMLHFTAPTQSGSYEFRYLVNDGFAAGTMASTASLTVTDTPAISGGPALPTLPQTTVDLTLPTQTGTVRNVSAGDTTALQNALNAATCGDTVVLVAGTTYTGNFTVPNTPCSGWIVIQSSQVSQFPPGTRVGPSQVLAMATIRSNLNGPAIQFQAGAHHWRLIGLEVTTMVGMTQTSLIETSVGGSQLSLLPHHIIVDRCYVHADRTASVRRGLSFQVAHGAVVDSYFSDFRQIGTDSQAIAVWSGPGPFLIQNNFLSAASENVMFGGADPDIPDLVPSDITIKGNHFSKDYMAWKGAGLAVKNLLEFKNAQRVLVDGNVLEYSWAEAQVGFAIMITPRNQYGRCTWCRVQDVTITSNLIRHAASGIETAPSDDIFVSLPTNRVLIQNNVLTDISTSYGGDGRGFLALSAPNSATRTTADNITVDHNSVFADTVFLYFGDSGTIPGFQFTNNLGTYGNYGIIGGNAGTGLSTLNAYVPNVVYGQNLLLTSSGGSDGNQWPNGTLWSTVADAQFTNHANANYQLLNTSSYRNAGTDGKDIGVWDWVGLTAKTTNAITGNYPY